MNRYTRNCRSPMSMINQTSELFFFIYQGSNYLQLFKQSFYLFMVSIGSGSYPYISCFPFVALLPLWITKTLNTSLSTPSPHTTGWLHLVQSSTYVPTTIGMYSNSFYYVAVIYMAFLMEDSNKGPQLYRYRYQLL